MKVLVLGGYAPSLLNFRGPMLAEMAERGHEVVACAPGEDEAVRAGLAAHGVQYRPIAMQRTGTNVAKDIMSLRELVHLLRDERPDVFLGYTIKPVVFGNWAARLAGVSSRNAMITGLGYAFGAASWKQRMLGTVIRPMYRSALAGCDTVFFQNPDDQALFERLGLVRRDQVQRIHGSGVDLEHFCRAPLPAGAPTFLLIARLLADKGILEYVGAARQVKRDRPDVRFLLVGPLDSNPAAISASDVQAWHDEGVLEYLGEADDVRPHLAACHVYVLPSYREGTPRTVLEAMATGRAIITTDASGCRETVEDGDNGFLVPVRDARSLATVMRRFLDDPALISNMGCRSRQIAEETYDVRKVNTVILDALGL